MSYQGKVAQNSAWHIVSAQYMLTITIFIIIIISVNDITSHRVAQAKILGVRSPGFTFQMYLDLNCSLTILPAACLVETIFFSYPTMLLPVLSLFFLGKSWKFSNDCILQVKVGNMTAIFLKLRSDHKAALSVVFLCNQKIQILCPGP